MSCPHGNHPDACDQCDAILKLDQSVQNIETALENLKARHLEELRAYELTVSNLRVERKPMTEEHVESLFASMYPQDAANIESNGLESIFSRTARRAFIANLRAVEAFHGITS